MLTWAAFDELPVEAFVTTRGGGVSAGPYGSLNLALHVGDDPAAVLENRRRLAAAIGADLGDMVFCNQVHGRRVAVVRGGDRGRGALGAGDAIAETDALVTAEPGIVLATLTADCLPIVLYDPVAHVLGCVHAGWRGTVARVGEAAVAAMRELGASPDRLVAGLGPAIGSERYQVGAEVAQAVERSLGAAAADVVRPDGTGRWLFDLATANRVVLREAGVADAHIHIAPYVTGDGLFFSDREARPCGRLALLARLLPGGDR